MTPTEHEIKVMKMMAGQIPWESGSWVNACVEFLREMGLCTRVRKLTEKGQKVLDTL